MEKVAEYKHELQREKFSEYRRRRADAAPSKTMPSRAPTWPSMDVDEEGDYNVGDNDDVGDDRGDSPAPRCAAFGLNLCSSAASR